MGTTSLNSTNTKHKNKNRRTKIKTKFPDKESCVVCPPHEIEIEMKNEHKTIGTKLVQLKSF